MRLDKMGRASASCKRLALLSTPCIIGFVVSGVVTVESLKLTKVCTIFSEACFCAYYYRS